MPAGLCKKLTVELVAVGFPAEERRRYQRANLVRPHPGRVGVARVYLIDVSLNGVRIAHQGTLPPPGQPCVLAFEWEGQPIELRCEVTRNVLDRLAKSAAEKSIYHAGLSILSADRQSQEGLRVMIGTLVARALDEQKANARGIPAVAPQAHQRSQPVHYRRHELIAGKWRETDTTDPAQPANGFTVAASHSPEEVTMLRSAYETADKASGGHELIRRMAKLSITTVEGVPSRRFMP